MSKAKAFSPQNLRGILGFLLFVLIAGGGALFYFGLEQLKSYSSDANKEIAAANAAEKRVDDLRALKVALSDSKNLTAKADALFSTSATYKAQLTTDIKNHAAAAGISVDNVTFDDAAVAQGHYLLTVEFKKTVNYESFIKFLDGIETNIPIMHVETLAINHVETDKKTIAVTKMQLKAAVR